MKEAIGLIDMTVRLFQGKIPGAVKCKMAFVDVRDVATAHYLALVKDIPNGSRIALV